MKTFQFTCLVDEKYPIQVLSLYEFKDYINLRKGDVVVENTEGLYQHGKVEAESWDLAKQKLESNWI